MNDDPYGNLLPSSSVLPLPLALLLFLLFFVLGRAFRHVRIRCGNG